MPDTDFEVTASDGNGRTTEPIVRVPPSSTAGLEASVQLEQLEGNRSEWIHGSVSSITRQALQLSVPLPTPLDRAARMRLRIAELRLDLTVAADSCWSRAGEGLQWKLGCSFAPPLPDDALKRLMAGDPLQPTSGAANRCLLRGTATVASENSRFAVRIEQFDHEGFVAVSSQPAKVGEVTRYHFEALDGVIAIDARTSWQLKTAEHYLIAGAWTAGEDHRRLQRMARAGRAASPDTSAAPIARIWNGPLSKWAPRLAGAITIACFAVPCLLLFYSSSGDGRAETKAENVGAELAHANPARESAEVSPERSAARSAITTESMIEAQSSDVPRQPQRFAAAKIDSPPDSPHDMPPDAARAVSERLKSLEAALASQTRQSAEHSQRLALRETQLAGNERQLALQRRQNDALREQLRQLTRDHAALLEKLHSLEQSRAHTETVDRHRDSLAVSAPDTEASEPASPPAGSSEASTVQARESWTKSAPAERVWTDASGRFHITATLLAVENGAVKLLKPDGRTASIELEKLSAADREYVSTGQATP